MRYGVIGNCKTAALIHENGSIDWCCLPNFDIPSSFGAILDSGGGRFAVRLKGKHETRQSYLPETNILQTEFDDGKNAFVAIDEELPDCAILDVKIADGEVYPLADALADAGVPLIFHSGHVPPVEIAERYPQAQACAKPCPPDRLISMIGCAIEEAETTH